MTAVRPSEIDQLAATLERKLRDIRATIGKPLQEKYAGGQLTGPQRSVMQAVFHSDGISLKELCARIGLAHSTTSGIVDRLEARGMLQRRPSAQDGRITLIMVTAAVRSFMQRTAPRMAMLPLVEGMRKATPAERRTILRGLETLERVLGISNDETSVAD